MKKISFIFTLFTILFFSFSTAASAASSTPTPKSSNPAMDQINALKERVASKVAELKLVDRRGIIGKVTETSSTQLTLTDVSGNTRFVDVDELTKFSSDSAKESFGISDIGKGKTLGVLGLYNKQSRRIMARFIDASLSLPTTVRGAVAEVDKEDFTFTVKTDEGKNYLFDVENITKTQSFTKTEGLVKSGFSKITTGAHIIVVGFLNTKDASRYIASRVLLFPEIPPDPAIPLSVSPQETIAPSTGSGKKLTPITR